MEDDMLLLCANARRFNEETSQIYIDSQELEKCFLAALASVMSEMDIGGGGGGSEEEDEGVMTTSVSHQYPSQHSAASSVHVVEIEGYVSDNSDGEWKVRSFMWIKRVIGRN